MLDFPAQSAGTFTPDRPTFGNRWRSDGTKWRAVRGWTLIEKAPKSVSNLGTLTFTIPAGYPQIEIRVMGLCTSPYNVGGGCEFQFNFGAGWTSLDDYPNCQTYSYAGGITGAGSQPSTMSVGAAALQLNWPSLYIFRISPGDANTFAAVNWTASAWYVPVPGILHAEGGGARVYAGQRATQCKISMSSGNTFQHWGYTVSGLSRE
jgi:hypothetical protein